MSKIKLAGKSISEILKRIKRAKRNKKATQNQEKAGLSTKSIKPFNYRAGARDEQIVPVKKQSQTGSSFQPHRVRGKQGAASIKETSEGSAASWRDEMDKYFGDLRPSKFFKKASGGDINTGMKKLSPKQKAIAAKAPPPDKIDAKDFAVLKAEKAKGRGMGLQDEKIKPGKVMKARDGKSIKADPTKPVNPFEKRRKQLGGGRSKLPGRIGTALGIGAMLVPAAYAAAKQYKDYKSAKNRDKAKVKKYSKGGGADTGRMGELKSKLSVAMDRAKKGMGSRPGGRLTRDDIKKATDILKNKKPKSGSSVTDIFKSYGKYDGKPIELSKGGGADTGRRTYSSMEEMRAAKGFKPGETPAQFNKRRMMLEGAKKAAKATKIGKIAAGIGAVGVAASQFLKKKMEEKKENKKMVGGMAKKYNKGGGADTGTVGTLRSMKINDEFPFKNFGKKEDRLTRRDLELAKAATSSTSNRVKKYAIARAMKDSDRLTERDIQKAKSSVKGKMGGGMMQRPMGYKKGVMVKARGCKLGRTRPTKIT